MGGPDNRVSVVWVALAAQRRESQIQQETLPEKNRNSRQPSPDVPGPPVLLFSSLRAFVLYSRVEVRVLLTFFLDISAGEDTGNVLQDIGGRFLIITTVADQA